LQELKRVRARLEEEEVDFDADGDSSYVQCDRLDKRICLIHKKICQLEGERADLERPTNKRFNYKGANP
jgi:hypothetical protein